jgi:hypothetical protein
LTLNDGIQPEGGETTVNPTTASTQSNAEVAYAADGSYVVVWEDALLDGDLSGIFFQRFDADGNPVGGETQANTTATDFQTSPAIAVDDAGNFVIVWQSMSQDQSGTYGVFGQQFNSSGVKVGTEFQVNVSVGADQQDPDVAMDSSGNYVVVWHDNHSTEDNVFMRRYDAAGTPLTGEVRVNTAATGNTQSAPSISMNSAGDYVVVWQSDHLVAGNFEVYGQRYDSAGNAVGSSFQVNSTTTDGQSNPDIVLNEDGSFVVVWESLWQDANPGWGVYGQRFDAAGAMVGTEFQINQEIVNTQFDAHVAADSDGNFTVVWSSNQQDGDSYGVYARSYDVAGNALTDEFLVNTTTASNQSASAIDMTGTGDIIITWHGNQTGALDIYSQRYSSGPALTFSVGDGTDDSTMTFTGTVGDINAALEGMTYTPNTAYNGIDTLTITTNDQGNTGTGGVLQDVDTVAITVGNAAAPVIDLNGADGGGSDFAASWTEGSGAVAVIDTDATLLDADENLTSLAVTITNLLDGTSESLSADTTGTGLIANYNTGTGVLTISGAGTAAEYQQVLRTVTYNNTSENPTSTARVITFTPSDASSDGNTAMTTLTMTATNDAPINTVPGLPLR